MVDQYLRDFAAHIRQQWAQGENWTEESCFQVQNLEDLAILDLESINGFYEMKEDRDDERDEES